MAEPLTLALALSLAILGSVLGWQAHSAAAPAVREEPVVPRLALRMYAPVFIERYVEALCQGDTAFLGRNTGENAGHMPWEPRLREWARPCVGHRYVGAVLDRLGRDQYIFTLVRPDGAEVLWLVTLGHDGLVAGVD